MSINPGLYGPLGTVVVAIISGLLLLWANKINKRVSKEDIADKVTEIWERTSTRLDTDLAACETRLTAANRRINKRDTATYQYMEKQRMHNDTVRRVVEAIEYVVAELMPPEQRATFAADLELMHQQDTDLQTAGRVLLEAMYT